MANRKLARKGRYGDTEIRNVAGRKSHVNRREAKAIDLYGMLGEMLVQREGAGTRNPRTGLPEYHWSYNPIHMARHAVEKIGQVGADIVEANTPDKPVAGPDPAEEFDKDAYMAAADKNAYLRDIGVPEDKLEYMASNINEDYLGEGGFLERAQGLTEAGAAVTEAGATLSETQAGKMYGKEGEAYTRAGAAFDIGKRGVAEAYRAGEEAYTIGGKEITEAGRAAGEAYRIGGLGIAEGRRAAGAQYGLGMERAGLGARRSLFDVKQQGDVAAARSGLATSGAIAATTGRAQKGIFQDYTMQQKSLAESKGAAMTGLGIQQMGLEEAKTAGAAARGFATDRLESAWKGTETQYGEGGISMAGLSEARRSTEAGADISYGGVMGYGTEGEPGYVQGSAGITRAGADVTRTGAQLAYETGVSDIGQTAEEEFWKNLQNINLSG